MDIIKQAIDAFKEAMNHAKNRDNELEAICESNIGDIYFRIIKNNEKARGHVYQSLILAETLKPKNVSNETWFKRATE